ncbi:MAG: hypothetical protein AB7E61_06425 [Acholeplasmataceae bacterium]
MSDDPSKIIEDIFNKYNKKTLGPLLIKGLDAAEKVMIKNLENNSEISNESGEHFKKSWESKHNYKHYQRYIHNTKKVMYDEPGRGPHLVPLSNILEYASTSPYRGRIRRTANKSKAAVIQAFVNKVKGGL